MMQAIRQHRARLALLLLGAAALGAAAMAHYGAVPPEVARQAAGLYGTATGFAAGLWARVAPASVPGPPARAAVAVPVQVAPVRAGAVPSFLTGIGTVQAYNAVSVRSRVDGELTQILFREGQDVAAGDPLALIDPRPLQAQLRQQEAARAKDQALLDGAVTELTRTQNLRDYASRQSLDQQRVLVEQYRAQLLSDEAQIEYARTQLGYAVIRSPIAGRVGIRLIDQGNFVRAGDAAPIVVVSQLQPISVVFTLAASAVARTRLTLGQASAPVVALAADGTTKLDEGTVELVDNQVDQSTGTIKLKASFPNAAMRLWPGDFVNGRIVVAVKQDALTVPGAALRHGPRGDFVWVVKPDGTAEYRAVTAGPAPDNRALIERGLRAGEQVVTEGHYRLENGTRVEVIRPQAPGRAPGQGPAQPATAPRPG